MDKINYLFYILLFASGFVVCLFISRCRADRTPTVEEIEKQLTDSFKMVRDSLNREVWSSRLVIGRYTRLNTALSQLISKNDIRDQERAKALTSAQKALIEAKKQTAQQGRELKRLALLKNKTVIITRTDTVYRTQADTNQFFASWSDPDRWASVQSRIFTTGREIDSIDHLLSVRNEFTITESRTKKGIEINVRNDNPFTYTDKGTYFFDLQDPGRKKVKRFGLAVSVGLDQRARFYAGVGLSYQLLPLF